MNTTSEIPFPVYFVKVLKRENQVYLQGVGSGGVTEMQVLDLTGLLVVPFSYFLTLPWCFPTQGKRKRVYMSLPSSSTGRLTENPPQVWFPWCQVL